MSAENTAEAEGKGWGPKRTPWSGPDSTRVSTIVHPNVLSSRKEMFALIRAAFGGLILQICLQDTNGLSATALLFNLASLQHAPTLNAGGIREVWHEIKYVVQLPCVLMRWRLALASKRHHLDVEDASHQGTQRQHQWPQEEGVLPRQDLGRFPYQQGAYNSLWKRGLATFLCFRATKTIFRPWLARLPAAANPWAQGP